jgi:hypothetical protein
LAGGAGGASAGTPRCGAGALALSVKHDGGGGGHQFYSLRLRNRSGHSCKIGGYPGVSLLDRRHHRVGPSAKRVDGGSHRFTLRAGQTAVAGFSTPTVDCGHGRTASKSSYVQVIPPNTRTALVAKVHALTCDLTVQPLRKSR